MGKYKCLQQGFYFTLDLQRMEREREREGERIRISWNSPVSEVGCSFFTLHLDILWVHVVSYFSHSGSWALAIVLNPAFGFTLPRTRKVILCPASFVCGGLLLYCIDNTAISQFGLALWCGQSLQIETGMRVCLGGKCSSWALGHLFLFLWRFLYHFFRKIMSGS